MKPVVVVVGSLNMDFVVRTSHLPAEGETVAGHGFRMMPGGKGANQAFAAGRLGAGNVTVRMIGRVGQDALADHLKASLSSAGVDVSAVHASKSQPTGVALISVDDAGRNQIVVAGGANLELHAGDVEAMRRIFRGARVALFQLETPIETVAAAMKIAREEGAITILDPAPAQALSVELLDSADILTPNEGEALTLAGRRLERTADAEWPAVAAQIATTGARAVVLKRGERGYWFHSQDLTFGEAAFQVKAVDTTGAGDTFNAALAVALAEGLGMERALRFANAAAALSVTRMGAQPSVPTRSETEALLSAGADGPTG